MNCTIAAVLKGPLETYSAAMPKRPTPAAWASIIVQVGTMLEASMELVVDVVDLTGKKDSLSFEKESAEPSGRNSLLNFQDFSAKWLKLCHFKAVCLLKKVS